MAEETLVGKISHYYNKLNVAIIDLAAPLNVGQTVHIKGAHDDFTQVIGEMQFELHSIESGKKGQSVGIKVSQKVHENDQVFLAA
jgi:hypothetical protein